jgi:hypothetical protein
MTGGIGYGPTQDYVSRKIVACGFFAKTLDKLERVGTWRLGFCGYSKGSFSGHFPRNQEKERPSKNHSQG